MNHTIRRQYLHLDLHGSEAEGFALQSRLPELCREELYQAIEAVFDRCAPATGWLCIERLEIDAGEVRPDRLEQELPGLVAKAVERALLQQTPPGKGQDGEVAAGSGALLKNDRRTALEAFLYFLEHGRLPWSFRLPAGTGLESHLLDYWGETGAGTEEVRFITRVLQALPACRRLSLQFSAPFLEKLLRQISASALASVETLLQASRRESASAIAPAFEKRLWETAFYRAARGGSVDAATVAALALAAIPESAAAVLPGLKTATGPAAAFVRLLRERSGAHFKDLIPVLEAVFGPLAPELRILPEDPTAPRQAPAVDRLRDSAGSDAPSVSGDRAIPASSGPALEEGIYVDNAGLVILHPFLLTFFESLGIARDGALLQPDRALHLLHFLCTGQSPAPEYALALPKVLCNIPLEAPADAGITLSDAEKAEAENLLRAAIRWWDALGNTSPDALRGTFLCRPGKLTPRDGGDWLLQVERQGFDVLLDQLPWGISAVKLGWMEGVVWVEWN